MSLCGTKIKKSCKYLIYKLKLLYINNKLGIYQQIIKKKCCIILYNVI